MRRCAITGAAVVTAVAWLSAAIVAAQGAASGEAPDVAEPVCGRWQTIDDETGLPRALVIVRVEAGELRGRIEHLSRGPGQPPDPVCTACGGERHGQKVVGMEILWGFHRRGDDWVGGRVLDPESGKEYRGRVWLEGEAALKVRGYWGPFHRTQTWKRAGPPSPRTKPVR